MKKFYQNLQENSSEWKKDNWLYNYRLIGTWNTAYQCAQQSKISRTIPFCLCFSITKIFEKMLRKEFFPELKDFFVINSMRISKIKRADRISLDNSSCCFSYFPFTTICTIFIWSSYKL